MDRRRIALAVAAVVGLGSAAVIAERALREPPPSHDMHLRYRVEFDVPPVEAALWFVDRYPEYFTSGEAGLEPWLDSLEPADRDFVLAMAQSLAWAWVEHELGALDRLAFEELGPAAITVVRHKTLNQLDELGADEFADTESLEFDAYFGDPTFGAGVFARAVRGTSNCEGQNHLLALLLTAALERRTSEIEVTMVGVSSGHELVRLDGGELGQPVFVDAWSNLAPFTIDPSRPHDAPLLHASPESIDADLVGFPAKPATEYANSRPTKVELAPPRAAPTKPVSLEIRAPSLDTADPWKRYMFARVLHLYDDPRAEQVYRSVIDERCAAPMKDSMYVCAAATLLLERLRPAAESPG